MKCSRGLWPYSPPNWENSLLQRVQNCNFAHMFNMLGALKTTKKTNGLKRLPWFSQLCVLWWCLKSIVLPIPLYLFRDHASWEATHLKMLIFQFFLVFLPQRKERRLVPLFVTVLLNEHARLHTLLQKADGMVQSTPTLVKLWDCPSAKDCGVWELWWKPAPVMLN